MKKKKIYVAFFFLFFSRHPDLTSTAFLRLISPATATEKTSFFQQFAPFETEMDSRRDFLVRFILIHLVSVCLAFTCWANFLVSCLLCQPTKEKNFFSFSMFSPNFLGISFSSSEHEHRSFCNERHGLITMISVFSRQQRYVRSGGWMSDFPRLTEVVSCLALGWKRWGGPEFRFKTLSLFPSSSFCGAKLTTKNILKKRDFGDKIAQPMQRDASRILKREYPQIWFYGHRCIFYRRFEREVDVICIVRFWPLLISRQGEICQKLQRTRLYNYTFGECNDEVCSTKWRDTFSDSIIFSSWRFLSFVIDQQQLVCSRL